MPESADFHQLVNQFDKTIAQNFFRSNPYVSLIPRKTFMTNQGEVPQVLSLKGEKPTAYPKRRCLR